MDDITRVVAKIVMNYVIKLGLFGALNSYVKYNIKKDWKLLKNKLVSSWSQIRKNLNQIIQEFDF